MTKRRPKGEGSVYRRKDGRVVGEYEDASGRNRYITSKTKTKAQMRALVEAGNLGQKTGKGFYEHG